jgi:hypothetical protein
VHEQLATHERVHEHVHTLLVSARFWNEKEIISPSPQHMGSATVQRIKQV